MLMFRTPTDDPSENATFYESEYAQGFTTDVPTDAALASLKQTNFADTERDYSYYIGVLRGLGLQPGCRIFDFGCSWGYGSYQLARAGFEVTSFEVAPRRRQYAKERLGVRTVDDMDETARSLSGMFDCFFSAHVIEHVPSPRQSFSYAIRLLKTSGLFVSFTPNGCTEHRTASPQWSKLWGEVHPNFIDDKFLDKSFAGSPRSIGSSPVEDASVARDDLSMMRLGELSGPELFFAARKVSDSW